MTGDILSLGDRKPPSRGTKALPFRRKLPAEIVSAAAIAERHGSTRPARLTRVLFRSLIAMLCVAFAAGQARAQSPTPCSEFELIEMLNNHATPEAIEAETRARGLDFVLRLDVETELRQAGANDQLIEALRPIALKLPPPPATRAEDGFRAGTLLAEYTQRHQALPHVHELEAEAAKFRQAIRVNPNDAAAHRELGLVLNREGDWDGMIAQEREAVRLDPGDEVAHRELANQLGNAMDLGGWIAEAQQAVRLNPDDALAHQSLALALSNRGDWVHAKAEAMEALRLDPADDTSHRVLAAAYDSEGNTVGWFSEWQAAVAANPNPASGHMMFGNALMQKHDLDRAISEYRAAIKADPNSAQAQHLLGYALAAKGDAQGAAQAYAVAAQLAPKVYRPDGSEVAKSPAGNGAARLATSAIAPSAAALSAPAPPAPFPSPTISGTSAPKRIRVGAEAFLKAKLISQTPPEYPKIAEMARVEGVVRLIILVDVDGVVRDAQLVYGPPLLVEAAKQAVLKWRFAPTRLNGQPVQVETEISVNFTLKE